METKEAIKKYWPWVLGGVAGLFVLSRMGGGSSSGSDPLAGMYAAQMQASAQNAAIGAQQRQAQMGYDLQSKAIDSQERQTTAALAAQVAGVNAQLQAQTQAQDNAFKLGMTELSAQSAIQLGGIEAQKAVALAGTAAQLQTNLSTVSAQRYIGTLNAQTEYAAASGTANLQAAQGAALIAAQMQQPAIVGMQTAAAENIAALNAASQIAAAGFASQAGQLASTADLAASYGNALAMQNFAVSNAVGSMAGSLGQQMAAVTKPVVNNAKSPWESVVSSVMGGFNISKGAA